MRYYFDWDPNKAKANRKKHRIGFEQASTIFPDPRMIAVFDTAHSKHEDRWATIGIDSNDILLVVIHTFQQLDANCCKIRIISARKATRKESKQYQEENK
ncbi:MAG: BrnT family toxin [Candidatus Kuenenia sp.]|nr:BrnT family toxin [Candidatus Kuenenia sp.]